MSVQPLESIKERLEKYSNLFLLFLVLILLISLARSVLRVRKAGQTIQEAQMRAEKLREENEELKAKLSEVSSEAYIEEQLRDKLGLAKEGEIVVVLPDEETLRKLAPKPADEEETLPDPNWKKWLKLFY